MPLILPSTISTPGNYPLDADIQPVLPEDIIRIIFASDIRGFTSCLVRNQRRVILFISEFFDEMAKIIQATFPESYVNKYLGDGVLAHFPSGPDSTETAERTIETAFLLLVLFINYIKKYDFPTMGLSIILSRELIFKGTIGKASYVDYTLVGKNVNRVFRALDSAKGNLILIFENLKDFIEDKYLLVNIGLQTYDGDYIPVELFSVMRKKENDEVGGNKRVCDKQCSDYRVCKAAWNRGCKKEEFMNCQYSNTNKCWYWNSCEKKYRYGIEHNGHDKFQCCHICSHFIKCFHNYYIGKCAPPGKTIPMIWCGESSRPYRIGSNL